MDLLDVELGRELGYTLKLLAIAKRRDEELEVRVHPTFLPEEDPLAKVSDVFNAIMVEGDFVGPTTSIRMDKYVEELLKLGLKGMIGKGYRSPPCKSTFVLVL